MGSSFPKYDRGGWSCWLLMRRQLQVLLADPASVLLLLGQPVLISALLALAVTQPSSIPKKLFLGGIAVLWLACSNAAQVIVRERPIFLRERLAGLRIWSYLFSKFVTMGLAASVQALLLYGGLRLLGNGLIGSPLWQLTAILAAAWVMTAIGLCISAGCNSTTQAAMAVPLVIIPQILFAGYVFPLEEWKTRPVAAVLGWTCPSRATQQLIDISYFWGRRLDRTSMEEQGLDSEYRDPPHWKNLRLTVVPPARWLGFGPTEFTVSPEQLAQVYAPQPGARPLKALPVKWPATPNLPLGRTYRHLQACQYPLLLMAVWLTLSLAVALWLLKNRANLTR